MDIHGKDGDEEMTAEIVPINYRQIETGSAPLEVERAAAFLGRSEDLREIKDVRDKTEAIGRYMRAHNAAIVSQQSAAMIVLVAERRLGELCKATEFSKGAAAKRGTAQVPRLDEFGISKNQSSRWQKVAAVKQRKLDAYFDECRDHHRVPTRAGLMKWGQEPREQAERSFSYNAELGRLETLLETWIARCPDERRKEVAAMLRKAAKEMGQ